MVDTAHQLYSEMRRAHWDAMALGKKAPAGAGACYRDQVAGIFRRIVPRGARVLELACSTGELLAALEPVHGVGVDFSPEMIALAARRHPEMKFICADVHGLRLDETFDYIILSDLVNDVWDVQQVLERLKPCCHAGTRIILNFYSRLWQMPLTLVRKMKLARPVLPQNWLTAEDMSGLLALAGFEVINHRLEVLLPFRVPLLAGFCNRFLVRFWPFNHFALVNVLIARPAPAVRPAEQLPTVTVLVPARNEEGNIPAIFARVPEMGGGTELVFVEGNSKDDTYGAIERGIREHPERKAVLYKQPGKGKGDAVRCGFARATGDVLMILDADLTVPPEDLPRFYAALVDGKGEFVNGVRLVYPMEDRAMRFFNLLGNKFFSLAFSWLLGQPVKDTLCGTKVLSRRDYESIVANRAYFGDFDPFGDFDLLFGAAKLNRKIIDLPVRYRERNYGETNIQRWRHGLLLLRMVMLAARKLKFA
jgi:SAM-dependent methyltransferase